TSTMGSPTQAVEVSSNVCRITSPPCAYTCASIDMLPPLWLQAELALYRACRTTAGGKIGDPNVNDVRAIRPSGLFHLRTRRSVVDVDDYVSAIANVVRWPRRERDHVRR